MENEPRSQVTRLLRDMTAGRDGARDELLTLVYEELRRLARARLQATPGGHTLPPTALVHEAILRLIGDKAPTWENRRHFFFAAARAMRDVLVEEARKKTAQKRGGGWRRIEPDRLEQVIDAPAEEILALDEALAKLEAEDPDKARLVQLRFFAGLGERETAEILGVSERTVQREWRYVKARLYRDLSAADHDESRVEGRGSS